jgi:hypothetical protein
MIGGMDLCGLIVGFIVTAFFKSDERLLLVFSSKYLKLNLGINIQEIKK